MGLRHAWNAAEGVTLCEYGESVGEARGVQPAGMANTAWAVATPGMANTLGARQKEPIGASVASEDIPDSAE